MSSTRRKSGRKKRSLGNKSYMDIFIREYFKNRDPRTLSDEEWYRGSLHWELSRALARKPESSREHVIKRELEIGIAEALKRDPRNQVLAQDVPLPLDEQLKRAIWRQPYPPLEKFKELQGNLETELKAVLDEYKKQMPITYYTPVIKTESQTLYSGDVSQHAHGPGQLPALLAGPGAPQKLQVKMVSPEAVCYECVPETICVECSDSSDSVPRPNGGATAANKVPIRNKAKDFMDLFLRNYLLQGRDPRFVTEEERYRGILHWELVRALQFTPGTEDERAIKSDFEKDVRNSINSDPRNRPVSSDANILEELKKALWREPCTPAQVYHDVQTALEQDLRKALGNFKQRIGVDDNSNNAGYFSTEPTIPSPGCPEVVYEYGPVLGCTQCQEEANLVTFEQVVYTAQPTDPGQYIPALTVDNYKGPTYQKLCQPTAREGVLSKDLRTAYAVVPSSQVLELANKNCVSVPALMGNTSVTNCPCPRKCDTRLCPYCGIGVFVKNTSNTGYVSAALCFPIGLYCCLTKKCCTIVECSFCRATTDKSLDEIYPFTRSGSESSFETDIRNRRWRTSQSKKRKPGPAWWTMHKGPFRGNYKSKIRSTSRRHRSRRRRSSSGSDKSGARHRRGAPNCSDREWWYESQRPVYTKRVANRKIPGAEPSVRVFYDGKDPLPIENQTNKC